MTYSYHQNSNHNNSDNQDLRPGRGRYRNNGGNYNGYNGSNGGGNSDNENRPIPTIVERCGMLSENPQSHWVKELNLVSWNGRAPRYEIREWDPNHVKMSKGITFSPEEILALRDVVNRLSDNIMQNASNISAAPAVGMTSAAAGSTTGAGFGSGAGAGTGAGFGSESGAAMGINSGFNDPAAQALSGASIGSGPDMNLNPAFRAPLAHNGTETEALA